MFISAKNPVVSPSVATISTISTNILLKFFQTFTRYLKVWKTTDQFSNGSYTSPPLLPLSCQEYIVTPFPLIKHLLHTPYDQNLPARPNSCYITLKHQPSNFWIKLNQFLLTIFWLADSTGRFARQPFWVKNLGEWAVFFMLSADEVFLDKDCSGWRNLTEESWLLSSVFLIKGFVISGSKGDWVRSSYLQYSQDGDLYHYYKQTMSVTCSCWIVQCHQGRPSCQ